MFSVSTQIMASQLIWRVEHKKLQVILVVQKLCRNELNNVQD